MSFKSAIIFPLLKFLNRIFGYSQPTEVIPHPEPVIQQEQIEAIAEEMGTPAPVLEEDEKKMIHGIFELGETLVKEIMIPRIDIICLEENTPLSEIKELVKKEGHSRYPLYKENIDNIVGILQVKDLFLAEEKGGKINLKKLTRPAYFIPESKRVDDLLREFKKQRIHIAVVVDEYGGTSGIVTLEDILEEIVGEIRDEYDTEENPIQKIDQYNFSIDAKLSLKEINEGLGTELPEEKFETIGGLIYDLVGSLPEQGKILEFQELKFCVEKIEGQRIKRVKITIPKKES
jgi:CBS domain containing-hemolysin-like protein